MQAAGFEIFSLAAGDESRCVANQKRNGLHAYGHNDWLSSCAASSIRIKSHCIELKPGADYYDYPGVSGKSLRVLEVFRDNLELATIRLLIENKLQNE